MKKLLSIEDNIWIYVVLFLILLFTLTFLSGTYIWVGLPTLATCALVSFYASKKGIKDSSSVSEIALLVFLFCGIAMMVKKNQLETQLLNTFLSGEVKSENVTVEPEEGSSYIDKVYYFSPNNPVDSLTCDLISWGAVAVCGISLLVVFSGIKGSNPDK